MAVVYRAFQPRVGREVAIKVIVPPYNQHPELIRRFDAEARALASLQHPHILPVLDVGVMRGQPYMVMTYAAGGTLTRRIAASERGLSIAQAVCVTNDIAAALDYAHSQGIVHRDVKPGNILLDAAGNAYLSDFGIALLASQVDAPQGTFAYMAPEVAHGDRALPASDIYALGMVIFEMLTGRRPYNVRDKEALLAAHEADPRPDVRKYRPELPAGVQVVLGQALLWEPGSRPPRASSLAAALSRASGLDQTPCPPAEARQEMRPFHAAVPSDEAQSPIRAIPPTPPPEGLPTPMPDGGPTPLPQAPAPEAEAAINHRPTRSIPTSVPAHTARPQAAPRNRADRLLIGIWLLALVGGMALLIGVALLLH
jgi:serine/threonine-protein kinase